MNAPVPSLLHIGVHASQTPQGRAIVMAATGEGTTYADLDKRSRQLAIHLRNSGLNRGDHLAILMRNSAEYLTVVWAAQRAGIYYTPVNWHLALDEIRYIIEDCEAKAIVTSPADHDVAIAATKGNARLLVRLVDGPARDQFSALSDVYASIPADSTIDECEGQSMFYSSGTTGRPKGIKRPLAGAAWGTLGMTDRITSQLYGINSHTVLLSLAPLYHAAPLSWAMATLRFGGTVVLMEKFDPLETLQLTEQYRVTHGHYVPTMFSRLLNLPEEQRSRFDVSSLRYVVHAAAPCPVDVKRRVIDWFGPIVYEYYSGSEGNGVCAVDSADWLTHPGTVGRAILGQVHILGENHEELVVGEVGMIYFGGTPPFEYHKDPEKSRSAFSKQGYSTLGDYGYIDSEGFVYIADRRTDLILSGGVNIYPRETEEALLLHPAVLDAAVVGRPSEEFGEDVLAVVELKPGFGASPELAAELITFCREKIAHFKCPRSVEFAALPRTATGKLLRRLLKDRFAATAG